MAQLNGLFAAYEDFACYEKNEFYFSDRTNFWRY